ncbi:ATP-binding protein [Streptomyces sp. NBC_00347]|uniref:ATP-binding protein n=1 Tax=Streptomyces sp. NBC_00347 TaxID=2975721 RepID=UPI0022508E1D|nr:ATP-binding protein [Streptomyces sp. NBC_00347]MCX5127016.1 ATP-binding protein [Streptomyces sp. NBC_00347]
MGTAGDPGGVTGSYEAVVTARRPSGQPAPPQARKHAWTVPLVPGSVRAARERTERSLVLFGLKSSSSLFGAVLLVVSELVANAVRHAQESPEAEVTLHMSDHMLVVGVADLDPSPITLADAGRISGTGLRTVADLARTFGGDLRIEPSTSGRGKTAVVRFILPGGTP